MQNNKSAVSEALVKTLKVPEDWTTKTFRLAPMEETCQLGDHGSHQHRLKTKQNQTKKRKKKILNKK